MPKSRNYVTRGGNFFFYLVPDIYQKLLTNPQCCQSLIPPAVNLYADGLEYAYFLLCIFAQFSNTGLIYNGYFESDKISTFFASVRPFFRSDLI